MYVGIPSLSSILLAVKQPYLLTRVRCQMSEEFWHDSSRIPIEITIAKAYSGILMSPSLLFSFEILMDK